MMNLHSGLFYLSITLFLCSANAQEPVLSEFSKTVTVNSTVTKIQSLDIGELVDMSVIDSVLVINEMFNENIFKLFSITSGKMICNCIRSGRGPNEMLYPDIITKCKNDIFSTYDQNLKKLIYISINDLIKGNFQFRKIDKLEIPAALKAYPINDSMIICTGVFEEGRYCLYNKQTKRKLIKKDLLWPPLHPEI